MPTIAIVGAGPGLVAAWADHPDRDHSHQARCELRVPAAGSESEHLLTREVVAAEHLGDWQAYSNLSGEELEEAVGELRELLGEIFASLKHAAGIHNLEPLKRSFDQAGLGERHARVMLTLAETGPVTVGVLAARMRLAPATTSLLAGELDRAGFLERREDDQDRRRTIVLLHEQLQAPLARFANARVEPLRRTLAGLEPAARSQFLESLRLLAAEATAAAEAREQDPWWHG